MWEQWNESTQSWQASQGYPYGDSFHPTGSGRRESWRALIPWQTTQAFAWNTVTTQSAQDPLGKPYSTLLGHNGEHTLRLESFGNQAAGYGFNGSNVTFASWEEGYRTMTYTTPFLAATRPFKVKNLVIKSVSPNDAILVGPQDEEDIEPVNFQVELDDSAASATYDLTLTLRQTLDPDTVIRTINQSVTGLGPHAISWDLKDDAGELVALFGGYFTYELTVTKANDTLQNYRSTFLKVTEDNLDFETDTDGNIVRDSQDRFHTIFKYRLNEAPKSQSVAVRFYSDLESLGVVENISQQNRWAATDPPVDMWLEATGEPSVRSVMSASDTRAASYRDHLPKRMLNHNAKKAPYRKFIGLTYCHPGAVAWQTPLTAFGYLREFARVATEPTTAYPQGRPVDQTATGTQPTILSGTLGWRVINSWPANSGDPYEHSITSTTSAEKAKMNSDSVFDQWSLHGPSPMSFTVSQNDIHSCYRLRPGTGRMEEYVYSADKCKGFEYRASGQNDSDGTSVYGTNGSKRNDGTNTNPKYTKNRYKVLNEHEGDAQIPDNTQSTHFDNDNGELWRGDEQPDPDELGLLPSNVRQYRQLLRIHSDGGEIGTDGCIGMRPDQMDLFWKRMDQIWAAQKAWHGTKAYIYVPLFVYGSTATSVPPTDVTGWGTTTWR